MFSPFSPAQKQTEILVRARLFVYRRNKRQTLHINHVTRS